MVSKRRKPVQRGPKLSGQLVGTAGDQPLSLPLVRTLVMDDNLGDGDGDLGDGDQPISLPLVLGPWWHSLKHRLFPVQIVLIPYFSPLILLLKVGQGVDP